MVTYFPWSFLWNRMKRNEKKKNPFCFLTLQLSSYLVSSCIWNFSFPKRSPRKSRNCCFGKIPVVRLSKRRSDLCCARNSEQGNRKLLVDFNYKHSHDFIHLSAQVIELKKIRRTRRKPSANCVPQSKIQNWGKSEGQKEWKLKTHEQFQWTHRAAWTLKQHLQKHTRQK